MYIKFLFLTLLAFYACNNEPSQKGGTPEFPELTGDYLGQKLPQDAPELFAPGIISNGLANRDVMISPDGKEMYFGIHTITFDYSSILVSKLENGFWTKPEVASFARDPRYTYLEPAFGMDGNKLFFLANLPKDSTENPGDEDIWVVEREGGEWGEPYNVGEPVNTSDQEFFPSLTKDETLYFTRAEVGNPVHSIYRSVWKDGKYSEPEKLPEQINCGANRFNAYVAPDESFVVIPAIGVEEGVPGINYYLVKRNEDDTWKDPVNMGEVFNAPGSRGYSFSLSPDSKYAFFMASRTMSEDKRPDELSLDFFMRRAVEPENGLVDIYWVKATVLDHLLQ